VLPRSAGLKLEKDHQGAGGTKADGTEGLRRPLFSDFRSANAPKNRGIWFKSQPIVLSNRLIMLVFFK